MDVYLTTLGCRLNEAELESWHRDFHARGHRVVATPNNAQVMVLNTCAVTGVAARKSRQHIYRLHRQNPSARLVITGCYAELAPERIAKMAGVDLVVGNLHKDRLVTLVADTLQDAAMPDIAADPQAEATHIYATSRTRAFVKVQDGCRNRCTFCIVTVLRGQERSRTTAEIIEQVNHLHHEHGFQEVVLTGVHLGGYGSDLDTDLYQLVQEVLANTDIPRLRLTSLEPWDLPENFWELWANPRLCSHLHLPLQSGCDSTLRRMARRCNTTNYRKLVESARELIPGLTLTTDIIVGFPGETEAEWKATYAYIEALRFAHIHIFTYSPREGTKAARMGGHLTKDTKRARSQALHTLAARMKSEHLQSFLGQVRPVLWEGDSTLTDDGQRRWQGYTDNYLRVVTHTAPEVDLENKLLPVQLSAHDNEAYRVAPPILA